MIVHVCLNKSFFGTCNLRDILCFKFQNQHYIVIGFAVSHVWRWFVVLVLGYVLVYVNSSRNMSLHIVVSLIHIQELALSLSRSLFLSYFFGIPTHYLFNFIFFLIRHFFKFYIVYEKIAWTCRSWTLSQLSWLANVGREKKWGNNGRWET